MKKDWYYYVLTIRDKAKWYPLQTKDVGVALKKWATLEAELRKHKNLSIPVLNGNELLFKIYGKNIKKKYMNLEVKKQNKRSCEL